MAFLPIAGLECESPENFSKIQCYDLYILREMNAKYLAGLYYDL